MLSNLPPFPMLNVDTFLKIAAVMFVEMWHAVKRVTSRLLCVGLLPQIQMRLLMLEEKSLQ
jgi:hypothetical protein